MKAQPLMTEKLREKLRKRFAPKVAPIPMILYCPECMQRHVDRGEFADRPHHTHACQECGMVWRPAVVPTVGVQFLPGFRDGDDSGTSEPSS